jgi:cytochrome P450
MLSDPDFVPFEPPPRPLGLLNLLTFIAAAHETTAVALTWTFWLLAKDQDVQQRLFDEVAALAGREPDRYPPCRRT